MTVETAVKTQSEPDTEQAPVVFSRSESVPLGFTNKLLRKASYGFGICSFILTGLSGVSNKNHWRTASGFGSAAVNLASFVMPEKDRALPDAPIPVQMGHAILKPGHNTLFFNRSASFVTDVLKLVAGVTSGRKTEVLEGTWKMGTKAVDIAGLSDQDKREKIAMSAPGQKAALKEDNSPLHKIFANRWVSLSNSAVAAGLQMAQGIEHRDRKMLVSGIFYFLAVSSLIADNAMMESKINKTDDRRRR